MLRIKVTSGEAFDEESEKFVDLDPEFLDFEHSLVSLSKWESSHEKPFLAKEEKSTEEVKDYLRDMLLTPDVSEETLQKLTEADYKKINEYINAKMTATWFRETKEGRRPQEIITQNSSTTG